MSKRPSLALRVRLTLLATVVTVLGPPIHTQAGGEYTVTIDAAAGRRSGTLRLPSSPTRHPVVLLASSTDTASLAAALAGKGAASLRIEPGQMEAETLAQWIAFLRNDERFPTVAVFAEGEPLLSAVVAARAARADGVITRGETSAAGEELARLVAGVAAVRPSTLEADAGRIATFARAVPALGRRGANNARPATARRSPRHVIMATVGAVRVSIEWGQAQKRDREIWGNLVSWDQVWMPGADEATVITTNGPITIGTIAVPAGDHTLYTLPSPTRFQLIVSRDVGQFHTVYDANLVLGRTDLTISARPDTVEGLTFAIEQGTAGTMLALSWDTHTYAAPLTAR